MQKAVNMATMQVYIYISHWWWQFKYIRVFIVVMWVYSVIYGGDVSSYIMAFIRVLTTPAPHCSPSPSNTHIDYRHTPKHNHTRTHRHTPIWTQTYTQTHAYSHPRTPMGYWPLYIQKMWSCFCSSHTQERARSCVQLLSIHIYIHSMRHSLKVTVSSSCQSTAKINHVVATKEMCLKIYHIL